MVQPGRTNVHSVNDYGSFHSNTCYYTILNTAVTNEHEINDNFLFILIYYYNFFFKLICDLRHRFFIFNIFQLILHSPLGSTFYTLGNSNTFVVKINEKNCQLTVVFVKSSTKTLISSNGKEALQHTRFSMRGILLSDHCYWQGEIYH